MGSYTCAGYSRLGTGIAGERTGGTRQHTMQTAQSLEEQANMFLRVADATTEEGSFAASTVEVGNMFTCVEGLDMWAAAAGMYGTEGDDGELAWQTDALCAQTDQEAFREECLKYAMDNDERFGIWGGLSERERRRLRKQAS